MKLSAPDFPHDCEWLNSAPIKLSSLRGRPVLLDFWTSCCINCLHTLPDLASLESEFGERGLVVIGVHAPKFPHEQDAANVEAAIARHGIKHPVVLDNHHLVWDSFAVKAWPSFVLIDCEGKIDLVVSGEGKREMLAKRISELVSSRSKFAPVGTTKPSSIQDAVNFRFPNKVVGHRAGSDVSLFVSDSSNDRIVELSRDGKFRRYLGGDELLGPQGLCVFRDKLYVCDTEHHRVVSFNLSTPDYSFTVELGCGRLGYLRQGADYDPLDIPLNSPWDICVWDGSLVIACAGSHQLAMYSPLRQMAYHLAGSGAEGLEDGSSLSCVLAQPSALCAVSVSQLAFIDSESSALRLLMVEPHLGQSFTAQTLVGEGLFDYGFQDGKGAAAKLQHPMGCAYSKLHHGIIICDTFNNALRFYSLERSILSTLPLQVELNEPNGVTIFENEIFVADCNNHRIVCIEEKELLRTMGTPCRTIEGPFGVFADFQKGSPFSRMV